jgi:hypothetical protein
MDMLAGISAMGNMLRYNRGCRSLVWSALTTSAQAAWNKMQKNATATILAATDNVFSSLADYNALSTLLTNEFVADADRQAALMKVSQNIDMINNNLDRGEKFMRLFSFA